MPDQKYQRLTRARTPRRFAAVTSMRSALWLGEDHLLLVETSGFTESYKRFFFRDIQAITVRTTRARAVVNWILAVAMILCLLPCDFRSLSAGNPGGGTIALLIFAAAFGIMLPVNSLFGTNCACQLRTAVQTEELPSLHRLRRARKVLDKIRPLIVAAQGQLTAEEVAIRMQETAFAAAATGRPAPAPGPVPPVIS